MIAIRSARVNSIGFCRYRASLNDIFVMYFYTFLLLPIDNNNNNNKKSGSQKESIRVYFFISVQSMVI